MKSGKHVMPLCKVTYFPRGGAKISAYFFGCKSLVVMQDGCLTVAEVSGLRCILRRIPALIFMSTRDEYARPATVFN